MQSSTAAVIGQLALVVSGTVAARALGVDGRGYLALIVLIPTLVVLIGSLGLPLAVTYELARGEHSPGAILRAIRTPVVTLLIVLTTAQACLIYVVFHDAAHNVLVAAAASLVAPSALLLQVLGQAILQGLERFTAFNLVRVAPPCTYALVICVLFLAEARSLIAFSAAWVATSLVCGLVTISVARRGIRMEPIAPPVSVRPLLSFGLRGLVGSASATETYRPDQVIVAAALPPSALGLYVTAVAISNLPRFIAQSIGMVAYPSVSRRRPDPNHALALGLRWTAVGLGLMAPLVAVLMLFADDLIRLLFGDAFVDASTTARLLLASALLFGLRRILSDALRGASWPGLASLAEAIAWPSLIVPAAFVVGPYGINGVGLAAVASAAVSLIALVIAGRRRTLRVAEAARSQRPLSA